MVSSHIAFSDEAYYTSSRYRSIAVISLAKSSLDEMSLDLTKLLLDSDVKEFKWQKLRQARERFAALKMIDCVMHYAIQKKTRIDVLIWDVYDHRHIIKNRDDKENFQRMYYHLFNNIFMNRWPRLSTWELYPDENSVINWDKLQEFLDSAGLEISYQAPLSTQEEFRISLWREFEILNIKEINSKDYVLCQVADLFAGLGVYSYLSYDKYQSWLSEQIGQKRLLSNRTDKKGFSSSEKNRFVVINYLDKICKSNRLTVGLNSTSGFKTYNPNNPLNFWFYEPQHVKDKAPTASDEE
ncbi:DUF3800 domain-containing protein [bacterium]|nr:DUF3800 domain-containing protein [bacterium]